MTANSQTCRKCGSPVSPGMKFCESCGAKIEDLPACRQCGAPLDPNVKFCESCGTPVSAAAEPAQPAQADAAPVIVPASPVPEAPPVQETTPPAEPVGITNAPAPAEKPVSPEPPVKTEEKPVPAPAPVKGSPEAKKQKVPEVTAQKNPIPQRTMIIAGVIVLAILAAAVYFVGLPMFTGNSGSGTSSPAVIPGSPAPAQNPPMVQPSAVTISPSGQVSFVTEPTQVPPANLLVTFQAERDPITGIVTVTYTGGARYAVRDVFIRLTRSDGQVDTRSITLAGIGPVATFQGTKTGDDRIEVTAYYFNGEQYRIIDRILEYKKRNW